MVGVGSQEVKNLGVGPDFWLVRWVVRGAGNVFDEWELLNCRS